jgi:cytidine deaminase
MENENSDIIKNISTICEIDENTMQNIIKESIDIRKNSYSPYSKFKVGSVLLTSSNKVYSAVNVENISYGLSNCAERSVIFSAISKGEREFKLITVCSDLEDFLTPCGACRQVINEFKIKNVVLVNKKGDIKYVSMDYLLPTSPDIPHLNKEVISN